MPLSTSLSEKQIRLLEGIKASLKPDSQRQIRINHQIEYCWFIYEEKKKGLGKP